jgi:hypothetical protein
MACDRSASTWDRGRCLHSLVSFIASNETTGTSGCVAASLAAKRLLPAPFAPVMINFRSIAVLFRDRASHELHRVAAGYALLVKLE